MSDINEDQKTKITLGFIISWGLGGLFLLSGLAGLFNPHAIGMSMASFMITALLLPPVRKVIHQKTGRSLSTGVRIVLFFALLFGGAMTMSGTQQQFNGVEVVQNIGAQNKAPSKGLVVESFMLERGAYGGKIVGTLKNTTNKTYKYVQIEFGLYDADGNTVGSTLANINNLDPDSTWRFEAPVFKAEAVEAQVKNITSF